MVLKLYDINGKKDITCTIMTRYGPPIILGKFLEINKYRFANNYVSTWYKVLHSCRIKCIVVILLVLLLKRKIRNSTVYTQIAKHSDYW